MFDQYKEKYPFAYEEDGVSYYWYENKVKLTLEQIDMCEKNPYTKACVIPDGHLVKGIFGDMSSWDFNQYDDILTMKSRVSGLTYSGIECIDPWGKRKLYVM